jgi:hypothetical protein
LVGSDGINQCANTFGGLEMACSHEQNNEQAAVANYHRTAPMQIIGCGYVLPQLVAALNLVCSVPSQKISLVMAQLSNLMCFRIFKIYKRYFGSESRMNS